MNETHSAHSHTFHIPSDHPTLKDHFPGWPLVPGALILEETLRGARYLQNEGNATLRIASIKFTSALQPGQDARIIYQQGTSKVRFEAFSMDELIASGLIIVVENEPTGT